MNRFVQCQARGTSRTATPAWMRTRQRLSSPDQRPAARQALNRRVQCQALDTSGVSDGTRPGRRTQLGGEVANVSDPEVDGFLALLAARRAPRTVEAYRRDLAG